MKGWTGEYDEQTLEQVLALKSELNARAEEKLAMQSALEPQIAENERLKAAHERQVAENARSQAQLKAMRASSSWRLTAPLRALAAFGRRR